MLAHRLVPDSDGLYDPANMPLLHHVHQALRAHTLFRLDVDYMIKDGGVVIVDEFTGRLMPGRRWSDGLHQAVEAKEKVKIERENQTLATITFQNYFRKYKKLSGMTGTAETEAAEFDKIYNLDVIVIPTEPHRCSASRSPTSSTAPSARSTRRSSTTSSSKQATGRPTLVGTVSIEKSERLSALLRKRGIKHVVLNAKYHAQEAEIVAQAGRKGNVTIATNMAGRGTDILLGGNAEHMARQQACRGGGRAAAQGRGEVRRRRGVRLLLPRRRLLPRAARATGSASSPTSSSRPTTEHEEVVALGGLHILGTERHEARRIDNQLRGRAGRQGDPGSSRFYLSLEDDLMRIFGSDRISGLMQRLGMEEGVPIEHGMVTARHRARAEAGRGAELLRPQAPARIRRRDEQAARERLHAAARGPRRQGPRHRGRGRRHARVPARRWPRRSSRTRSSASPARRSTSRSGTCRRSSARASRVFGLDPRRDRGARARRQERRGDRRRHLGAGQGELRGEGSSWSAPSCCGASSATSCCRSSTRSGRITSTRSTT